MKNKINKILLVISFVLLISILFLFLLGLNNRIGYLSDFNLQSSNNGEYVYNFRIKYYSKIFGNSDIYGVYIDTNKAIEDNSFIKEITMEHKGSPFGILISSQVINTEKIDNVYYHLKLKPIILILFVLLSAVIIFTVIKNRNSIKYFGIKHKNILLRVYFIFLALIIISISILFILGNISHKAFLSDLELIAESKLGYVYKAKVSINEKSILSPNLIWEYPNKFSFDKNIDYIKSGYNIEITRQPDWYNEGIGALVWTNEDGSFTVSNSTSWNGYKYDINPSVGETYKISIEAKKIFSDVLAQTIKYHLDEANNGISIPGTANIINEYKTYISQIDIKSTKKNTHPHFDLYFPRGIFNIKNIKIEQLNSDYLYIKDKNQLIFTSSKKIENISEINDINLTYSLSPNNYICVSIVCYFILVILSAIIYIFRKPIILFFNKIKNIYHNYNKYDDNNTLVLENLHISKKISNILFIVYLIVISIIVMAMNYIIVPYMDNFFYAAVYDNVFYNIFKFDGYFWQRGRQLADILGSLNMKPFGNILIYLFNMEPIKAFMVSQAIFALIYVLLITFSVSIFIWIFNNKRNYRLIFIIISLYILNYTALFNYLILGAYVATSGFAFLVFFPMLYYLAYEKELLILKNRNINYMLLLILLYFATFSIEPVSTALAGLSFFIILYLLISRTTNLFSNKIKSTNIYILFTLLSTIVLTIIGFSQTLFRKGSRGQWQLDRIENTTIFDNIKNTYSRLDDFNKILLIISIIFLIIIILKIIVKIINKKNIKKEDYIYFSILFTGLFLAFCFLSIKVNSIYTQLILLFSFIVLILLKNINNKKAIISIISSFIVFSLIINMSLKALTNADIKFKENKYTLYAFESLVNIYKEADKNNYDMIVLSKDDVEKLHLNSFFRYAGEFTDDSQSYHNRIFSSFMERYYTSRFIPIIVKNTQ